MSDVFWFFVLLSACLGAFAVLHIVGLRLQRPVRLIRYLMANYVVSAIIALGSIYWIFGDPFSSPGSCTVANTGAFIAGFFASAFYIFIGPATADRSLTAHLLIYLRPFKIEGVTEANILRSFSPDAFFQKRYRECRRAGLLDDSGGAIRLSSKGRFMASLYQTILRVLSLRERKEYLFSFPPQQENRP